MIKYRLEILVVKRGKRGGPNVTEWTAPPRLRGYVGDVGYAALCGERDGILRRIGAMRAKLAVRNRRTGAARLSLSQIPGIALSARVVEETR